MQFAIIARDGADMLEKRLAVRPRHLENAANAKGRIICAGGMLDDKGKMKGSVMIMDFESRELLEEYLATEPYLLEHVWETVEAVPFNTVIVNGEHVGKQ